MKRILSFFVLVSMTALVSAERITSYKANSRARNNDRGIYVGFGSGILRASKFQGAEDSYVAAKPKSSGKALPLYNAFVGYKYNQYFRFDLNGQYREFNYNVKDILLDNTSSSVATGNLSQKIKNMSLFINGYVDIPTSTVFTPYITAGLGYSHNDSGDLIRKSNNSDFNFVAKGNKINNFSWNLGLGSRIKIYDNIDLDISYRYADLGKVGHKSTFDEVSDIPSVSQNLKVHQGIIGISYNF